MPFVSNMQEEEDQAKQQQNQPPSAGGAVRLAPSSAVQAGGPGAMGTNASPAKGGGQFASLNQYLTANQGQAEPLAGKLTAGIGKQYEELGSQSQQALSNISGQVAASPDYSKANETIAAESANPASFTSSPNNVASFQNLLNASYSGPTSAESTSDYATQQANINKAISQGQSAVQSEAGRENLLAANEARPTTGVTALNSAILSKSPEALASVQNAYQPFQNLLTGLSSGAAKINQDIASRQSQATAAKQAATNAITSQMSALNTNVANETTAAQNALAAKNAAVKAELASGNPSDASLAALGMSRDQWDALSAAQKAAATSEVVYADARNQVGAQTGTTNIDLGQFLTQGVPTTAVTAANAATPEDYAKAQAFQTLLGGMNLATPTLAINPAAVSQAGTAPTNINQFDYQTALNTAQQAKANEMAAAQAYVDAIQAGYDENHAQLAAQDAAKKAAVIGGATLLGGATPAAMYGYGSGVNKALQSDISNPSLTRTADLLNSIGGPKGTINMLQGAATGVVDAVKTVTNIFCFHPDTLVTMADGSLMPIYKIEVGDMTKGGRVLATTRAVASEFYWYSGVIVTGKHAVKENGRWIRVEDSGFANKFGDLVEVVCNLVTEKHRIYANGIEFADQNETDMYESLDMNESLKALNNEHVG